MLKIIPLGGMNVTKNLFVYETDTEILLVDCGIGFPDDEMFGVDLLLPDTTYLEKTKKKIVGMLLSHGHDDHIAGLPYILPKLPDFPIFSSKLTAGFAKERMKEFGIQKDISILDDERGIRLGNFAIESVKVTHSVPDARHFLISTQSMNIYHGSDFKFDLTPIDGVRPEFQKIAELGKRGITALLSDCLRSERSGFSPSEATVRNSISGEIEKAKGKVIVTIMSSNIHRIQQIVDVAYRNGRKVAFFGRSIENNVRVATELGFLHLPNNVVKKNRIRNIKDNKLCLLVAGSQGQSESSLVRVAHDEHRQITIKPEDTIIFASDAIPGNERPVYETIDAFFQKGAEVIYSDIKKDLHVSGHASAGELMLLMELTKPKYLIPIGGTYRQMVHYRKIAREIGYKKESVFLLEEGQACEINSQGLAKTGQTIPLKNVMVDGLGIGDVGRVVLRDRKVMAEEGMLVAIVPLDIQAGQISGEIEIISRGFVYMKESKELIEKARQEVISSIRGTKAPITEWNALRERIRKNLEKMLFKELKRLPMVIPIIIRT